MKSRLSLAGFARFTGCPQVPFITVWIENVGEVKGIVDSGASMSIIKSSVVKKILASGNRNIGSSFLRGVDNRLIPIDSNLSLKIKWEGSFVEIDQVAVTRDMPFAIILGVDWIVKSETSLVVRDGRIVLTPKKQEIPQPKQAEGRKKKVRFAGIDERTIEQDDDEYISISDELIESIQKDSPPKRSKACPARLVGPVSIPGETLLFCAARVPHNHTGTGMVHITQCYHPGKSWTIPSCLVAIKKGKFKIPIVNLGPTSCRLKESDVLAQVDLDGFQEICVVSEESGSVGFCGTAVTESGDSRVNDFFLNDVVLGEGLSQDQKDEVYDLLRRRVGCLKPKGGGLDRTEWAEHHIDTGDARPVSSRAYRVSAFERKVIDEHVNRMLDEGVIQPSFSPWSSPVVLAKKKTPGEYRFCVDYRRLNALTKRDVYPLPSLDDVFDRLAGAEFFSSLDMRNGFHQIPMAKSDRCKTGFTTPGGLFEFVTMPFGLSNAPATFQRMMDRVLGNLKWQMCLVYLDDVLVFGRTFEEHMYRLNLVLEALEKAGLTLNVSKCIFAAREIFHLGHLIDKNGIRPGPEKIRALRDYVIKDIKSLRGFLGLASFFRRFVKDFGSIASPLHALLKKKVVWSWGPTQEAARAALVTRLTSAPVLAHFDDKLDIIVQTDASHCGLGAVLLQDGGDGQRPVAFISKRLTDAETRYHANELECLAVVWALKKLRAYLYGRQFRVQTDSSAVRWLCEKNELTGKFARWILRLQEFDFTISHIKGVDNCVADALSRDPVGESETEHVVCILTSNKPLGYSAEELGFQQRLDPQLKPIFAYFGRSVNKNRKCKVREHFAISGGVLYKKNDAGKGRKFLLCVPKPLRNFILEFSHDDPSSGHLGVDKTVGRVMERYWWPRLSRSVRCYVLSCSYCQLHKHERGRPAGLLHPIPPPSRPFESLNIDHLGPFKKTADRMEYIIVCVDYLTKWVEAEAVPNTCSSHVVRFLHRNIICRHGHPDRFISDQGPSFTSKETAEAMEKWKVKHVFATAEHPQTSGLVEKCNGTLTSVLAAYVNVQHNDWNEHLSSAVYAINTAQQCTTERTPFELVYGRLPNTALENEFCWPSEAPEPFPTFIERLREMREEVRIRIIGKQEKTKRYVDARRRVVRDLCPGELVLVRRHLKQKGKTKKFLPKFVGPFQVIQKVCPTSYLVEDLPSKRKKKTYRRFRAHVCQIRKFRVREPAFQEDINIDLESDQTPDDPPPPKETPPTADPPTPDTTFPLPGPPPVKTRSGRTSHPSIWLNDYVR